MTNNFLPYVLVVAAVTTAVGAAAPLLLKRYTAASHQYHHLHDLDVDPHVKAQVQKMKLSVVQYLMYYHVPYDGDYFDESNPNMPMPRQHFVNLVNLALDTINAKLLCGTNYALRYGIPPNVEVRDRTFRVYNVYVSPRASSIGYAVANHATNDIDGTMYYKISNSYGFLWNSQNLRGFVSMHNVYLNVVPHFRNKMWYDYNVILTVLIREIIHTLGMNEHLTNMNYIIERGGGCKNYTLPSMYFDTAEEVNETLEFIVDVTRHHAWISDSCAVSRNKLRGLDLFFKMAKEQMPLPYTDIPSDFSVIDNLYMLYVKHAMLWKSSVFNSTGKMPLTKLSQLSELYSEAKFDSIRKIYLWQDAHNVYLYLGNYMNSYIVIPRRETMSRGQCFFVARPHSDDIRLDAIRRFKTQRHTNNDTRVSCTNMDNIVDYDDAMYVIKYNSSVSILVRTLSNIYTFYAVVNGQCATHWLYMPVFVRTLCDISED